MRKLPAGLALAGVCIPVYLWVAASPFGLSAEFPIGKFGVMEAWLLDQGFVKQEFDDAEAKRREMKGEKFFGFREARKDDGGDVTYMVAIGVGRNDVIRWIRAGFHSAKEESSGVSNSWTEDFALLLWSDFAGADPVFLDRHTGKGVFFKQGLGATVKSGSATGDWYKRYLETSRKRSITDVITFTNEP